MRRVLTAGIVASCLLLGRVPEAEATVMFNGASSGLSASAAFTVTGTTLTILLTNTDPSPSGAEWVPAEALTGLFFNLGTADNFSPVSATVAAGSVAQFAQCNAGACSAATTNVGGEWSYAFGGVVDPDIVGTNRGIASAGYLNAHTSAGNFGGTNLDNPGALGGTNFGIMPSTFVDNSGNGGLDNDPLIKGSATFVLTIPTGLSESTISNVYFTYGTSLQEPSFQGQPNTGGGPGPNSVPEPSMLVLLGAGLALAARGLRARMQSRPAPPQTKSL